VKTRKHLPPMHNKSILPSDKPILHHQLSPRRQAPASRSEGGVQNTSVLDLGQVDDAVGFDFNIVRVNGRL